MIGILSAFLMAILLYGLGLKVWNCSVAIGANGSRTTETSIVDWMIAIGGAGVYYIHFWV